MKKLLNDILIINDKGRLRYSIGRVLLLFSALCFFVLNITMGVGAVTGAVFEDKEILQTVSQNLIWALGTFGLYVLGGKGVGAYKETHPTDEEKPERTQGKNRKRKSDGEDFYNPDNEEVL